MDLKKIQYELCRLENGIIQERKKLPRDSGSSFSYWLYEKRVEDYQRTWRELSGQEETEICEESSAQNGELAKQGGKLSITCQMQILKRLEDVKKQANIDMEDFPDDAETEERAGEIIRKAESLRDYCIRM